MGSVGCFRILIQLISKQRSFIEDFMRKVNNSIRASHWTHAITFTLIEMDNIKKSPDMMKIQIPKIIKTKSACTVLFS